MIVAIHWFRPWIYVTRNELDKHTYDAQCLVCEMGRQHNDANVIRGWVRPHLGCGYWDRLSEVQNLCVAHGTEAMYYAMMQGNPFDRQLRHLSND